MTTETTAAVLDWRALASEPEVHWCGCDYCPMDGEYEGGVLEGSGRPRRALARAVTEEPADGLTFRDSTREVIRLTGWRLVLLAHPDGAGKRDRRRVGIVNQAGEHIGWAISERWDD